MRILQSTRRHLWAGLSALLLCASALVAAERKPNFLFVYTDDQRWDAMGVVQREQGDKARFPWFQTPAMDRLAAEGARFRNAFVTLSLCAPSRAAFLTGAYNHLNGIANNRTSFATNSVTYATVLRQAGYTTAYIGKWHMGGQRGQRPGFDYSASFIGQGKYWDCPFEINGEPKPSTGWVDDVSTDYAIAFLKQHAAKPFALVVGFKACHGPFDPPPRARERFAGAEARPVPNLATPPIYREDTNETFKALQVGADGKVKVNLGYFRCVSAADDNLGRLLKTLDDLKLAEDTVVVFCGDNGYYLGEHQLGDKRSCYEESIRIPLLLRYPRLVSKGKLVDQMVLNIDVAPTFLELAGAALPSTMQGKSWAPLFAGKTADWRKAIFCEYFREQAFPGTPTCFAVRTETAKFIKYPGHEAWTELFDLKADPYETRNLATDPKQKALLDQMLAEYDKQSKAAAFRVPEYADEVSIPGFADQPARKDKGKKKRAAASE